MKLFRMFFRSIRDAFKSVIRNFSLSLASISCITITLIIIGATFMISKNVANFTYLIEKDVTIVAFLDSDVTADERKSFEESIKNMENVDTYEFISKSDVKLEMENEDDAVSDILSGWSESENPLLDTYRIKVVEVDKIKATASDIRNLENVDSVQYGEGLVEQLVGAFDTVKKITIIVGIALVIVTTFLIINTIKLTIFSRKREISIMRLVGSSNSRIKMPFVIEGIILGIIGSVIPIVTITYGYTALYNSLGGQLFSSLIRLIRPMPFTLQISAVVLVIGIIVGMIGSSRAVRRYVKI